MEPQETNELQMDCSDETGLDMLCRLGMNLKYGSGVEAIDRLMGGGFEPGEVCELVGKQAAGKTQLLYGMAASFLLRHSGFVLWIQSGGSFLPCRLLQFLPEGEQDHLLDRILIVNAFGPVELIQTINKTKEFKRVKLVLIDGVGSILYKCTWSRGDGRRQMECVMNDLSRCASNGTTVILSNHLVRKGPDLFPSLGAIWRKRVTKRFLVGRDEISRFFRPVSEENEDFKSNGTGAARFSVGDRGVYDYNDLSLRSSI